MSLFGLFTQVVGQIFPDQVCDEGGNARIVVFVQLGEQEVFNLFISSCEECFVHDECAAKCMVEVEQIILRLGNIDHWHRMNLLCLHNEGGMLGPCLESQRRPTHLCR